MLLSNRILSSNPYLKNYFLLAYISLITGEAEKLPDSDIQRRLLAAAKTLADATARMVEAARQCGNHPHDVAYQDTLRKTAEDLRDVTSVAASTPALRAKLVNRVEVSLITCEKFGRVFEWFCCSIAQEKQFLQQRSVLQPNRLVVRLILIS